MEKIAVQHGLTVVTLRHPHLKRLLAGTLAGAMVEMELEILEAGGTSLEEVGESSTLKRHKGAGMPQVLLPRMHRLVPGAEQLAQLVPVRVAVTAWKEIPSKESAHPEIIQLLFCLLRIWTPGFCVTLAGDKPLFVSIPPGTWRMPNAKLKALSHGALV